MPFGPTTAIAILTGLALLVLAVAAVVHRTRRKEGGSVTGMVAVAVLLLLLGMALGMLYWLAPQVLPF